MIDFNNGRPEQVVLEAIPDDPEILKIFKATRHRTLGRFVVNPYDNTITYTLPRGLVSEDVELHIHGYVPRGWITDSLVKLPAKERVGVWHYPEEQEKNILAGLAYLRIQTKSGQEKAFRIQIEPINLPPAKFEDFVTVTPMAGACQGNGTIRGVVEDQPLIMEPAQVIIARSAARETEDGRREQEIGCAVRVGGAFLPGVGKIEIGMFGTNNPGRIVSMQKGSDFPARMTLDVRKHYMTPFGTFYRDKEEFVAENIMRFPPFGVKFTPIEPIAPLYEEKTGEIVGEIKLGWLVPLCYLDASNFPPRALPTFEEEKV
jgi:hypothetical protein